MVGLMGLNSPEVRDVQNCYLLPPNAKNPQQLHSGSDVDAALLIAGSCRGWKYK